MKVHHVIRKIKSYLWAYVVDFKRMSFTLHKSNKMYRKTYDWLIVSGNTNGYNVQIQTILPLLIIVIILGK